MTMQTIFGARVHFGAEMLQWETESSSIRKHLLQTVKCKQQWSLHFPLGHDVYWNIIYKDKTLLFT